MDGLLDFPQVFMLSILMLSVPFLYVGMGNVFIKVKCKYRQTRLVISYNSKSKYLTSVAASLANAPPCAKEAANFLLSVPEIIIIDLIGRLIVRSVFLLEMLVT